MILVSGATGQLGQSVVNHLSVVRCFGSDLRFN